MVYVTVCSKLSTVHNMNPLQGILGIPKSYLHPTACHVALSVSLPMVKRAGEMQVYSILSFTLRTAHSLPREMVLV